MSQTTGMHAHCENLDIPNPEEVAYVTEQLLSCDTEQSLKSYCETLELCVSVQNDQSRV